MNGPHAQRTKVVHPTQQRLPAWWFFNPVNFGDQLGPAIVTALTGVDPTIVPVTTAGKLLTVGSILGRVLPHDTVWGTGLLSLQQVDLTDVNVLALRGPLTAKVARFDANVAMGDPALLLPSLYTPVAPATTTPIGFVPHYVDLPSAQELAPDLPVISVHDPWPDVVNAIAACDLVVTSSLHGLIVAEAYGIPAVWARTRDQLIGGDFKFRDYYAATGRDLPEAVGPVIDTREVRQRATAPPPLPAQHLVEPLMRWFASLPQ